MLTLIITILPLNAHLGGEKKIIGKWEAQEKGEVGSIVFFEKKKREKFAFASLTASGETLGGPYASPAQGRVTYTINDRSKPIKVNFDINMDGEKYQMLAIAEFEGKNQLKMAIGEIGGSRPVEFTNKNTTLFIRKKK